MLGRVDSVRFEAGQVVATLRISNPAALDAIERGDVTGVSIGYKVTRWNDSTDPTTGERTRTAAAWTLLEVSLVPVPADPLALIRSQTVTTQTQQTPIETRAAIRAIAQSVGLDATWVGTRHAV